MTATKQEAIGQMFDRIASSYDLVNRILSFRQDVRWRNAVACKLPSDTNIKVLDLATGTADLLITMCHLRPNIHEAVGIDLSEQMLSFGREKISRSNLDGKVTLEQANATELKFADESFDAVSIAFGIRNVTRMDLALKEMARVLKPDGQALILEFSLPKNPVLKFLYLFYFRYILPTLGGILARDIPAYRYLNRSVEAFPDVNEFSFIIRRNGFKSVDITSLCFGIATIYLARKS